MECDKSVPKTLAKKDKLKAGAIESRLNELKKAPNKRVIVVDSDVFKNFRREYEDKGGGGKRKRM